MTNEDIEKFGNETIPVPDLCRDSVAPLVDIIAANKSKAVTDAAVRLAIRLGYETGRSEPRMGEYGTLTRSPTPPTVRGPGWGS